MPVVTRVEAKSRFQRFTEGGGSPFDFGGAILHEVGLCDEQGNRYLREDSCRNPYTGETHNVPTVADKPKRKPTDFHWDILAEAMIGPDWQRHVGLNRSDAGAGIVREMKARFERTAMFREEATVGIGPSVWANVAAWSATVGGLMQAQFIQGYKMAPFGALANMFAVRPAVFWQGGERYIDIIGPYFPAPAIAPGAEYPDMSMSALWVEPGPMTKYGGKISMQKETAAIDISGGQMLAKMKNGGETLSLRETELSLDVIVGYTNNWKLGMLTDPSATAYNTFGPTITSPQGVARLVTNDILNPFNDLGALQVSDENLANLYHPVTDQPMESSLDTVLFPTPLMKFADELNNADEYDLMTQSTAGPAQPPAGSFPTAKTKMRNPWKGRVRALLDEGIARRLDDRQIRSTVQTDPNINPGLGLTGQARYRWYRLNAALFACKRQFWPATTVDISPADWVMAVQGLVAAQVFDIATQVQVLNPYAIQRNRAA